MNNGYYMATGAMVTQFNRLDVISNNLANVNTTAFKQDDVVIGDFERIFQEKRDNLPIRDHTKEAAKFLNRSIDRVPQISREYVKYDQGALKSTGNTFDFALKQKNAFFVVNTPQGERLTQNGNFTLNDKGVLVTKEGYEVLSKQGKIAFAYNDRVVADKSGNIFVNNEARSQFRIVTPSDIRTLQKQGDNLYKFTDEKELDATGANDDILAQGFLEVSNVNPVRQMTALIEASRLVEMYQKVMTTHMDDLNNEAINKLATPKA